MRTKWWRWTFLVALSSLACAPRHAEGAQAPYSIQLEDVHGRRLRTFHHGGQWFVLGHYGDRYNIRVRNHTGRRVEAVVSVDGRDVISGNEGGFGERGYLVKPHDSVLIEGFRTSLHGVAAFRFTSPGDSYSSRMGTPENVGVVGAAFFPERRVRRRPPPPPIARPAPRGSSSGGRGASRSAPADSKSSAGAGGQGRASAAESARAQRNRGGHAEMDAESSNIGTQYGEHRHSRVREVHFVRAHPQRPREVITLRYDDEAGLLARGIQVNPPRHHVHPHYPVPPRAFPVSRFAPPPPGY